MHAHVIPVRINAEKDRTSADRYKVNRWPTDVYLFPNGDEIYRGTSNQDPTVFEKTLERVALRNRDWNLEQRSIVEARERRQDRRLADMSHASRSGIPGDGMAPKTHPVVAKSSHWTTDGTGTNTTVKVSLNGNSDPGSPTEPMPNNQPLGPRAVSNPYANQPAPTPSHPTASHPTASVPIPPATPIAANTIAAIPVATTPSVAARSVAAPTGATPSVATPTVTVPTVTAPTVTGPSVTGPSVAGPSVAGPSVAGTTSVPPVGGQPSSTPPQAPSWNEATSGQIALLTQAPGLNGYCPVALQNAIRHPNAPGATSPWVRGNAQFAVRHRGRIYHCESEQARTALLANPDRFAPALSGCDLVEFAKTGDWVDGNCEFGFIEQRTGRVFLFSSRANCEEFARNCEAYSQMVGTPAERVASDAAGPVQR